MEETVTERWKKQWLRDGRNIDWEMDEALIGRWEKQ
jgi:hypothetical protein